VIWRDWYIELVGLANEAGLEREEYEGGLRQGDEFVHSLFRDGLTPQEALVFVRDKAERHRRRKAKGQGHATLARRYGRAGTAKRIVCPDCGAPMLTLTPNQAPATHGCMACLKADLPWRYIKVGRKFVPETLSTRGGRG
jgi:hypothetical protein